MHMRGGNERTGPQLYICLAQHISSCEPAVLCSGQDPCSSDVNTECNPTTAKLVAHEVNTPPNY